MVFVDVISPYFVVFSGQGIIVNVFRYQLSVKS